MVNDTLGHQIGDDLIIDCSTILKESFKGIGEIFRIGGDEFVVLIVAPYPAALYKLASETLEKLVEQYNGEETRPYYIGKIGRAHV